MTLTELRWAWTIIAALGVALTIWLVNDSIKSFGSVRYGVRRHLAVSWGPRWWSALEDMGISIGMQIVFLGFMVIGIMAVGMEPPPPDSERESAATTAALIFIGMEVVLLAVTAWRIIARMKGRERPLRTISVSVSREAIKDVRKLCHDMNGNLAVVVGKVSLMETAGQLTPAQSQDLAEADVALSRLAQDVKSVQVLMRSLDAVGDPQADYERRQAGGSGKT